MVRRVMTKQKQETPQLEQSVPHTDPTTHAKRTGVKKMIQTGSRKLSRRKKPRVTTSIEKLISE